MYLWSSWMGPDGLQTRTHDSTPWSSKGLDRDSEVAKQEVSAFLSNPLTHLNQTWYVDSWHHHGDTQNIGWPLTSRGTYSVQSSWNSAYDLQSKLNKCVKQLFQIQNHLVVTAMMILGAISLKCISASSSHLIVCRNLTMNWFDDEGQGFLLICPRCMCFKLRS